MTDDWDFYFCIVNEKPASIFVDLGLAVEAPLADYPFMTYVRLPLRAPMPDGLSDEAETAALAEIEDQLEEQLTADDAVVYVGRSTSNGTRDFFFYASDDAEWESRVERAMEGFEDYQYEAGSRLDEEWAAYLRFLRPSGMSLQTIENRRLCQALELRGDKLTSPREIDHLVQLPTREATADFRRRAAKLGFNLRREPSTAQGRTEIDVQVFRVDVPSLENIDEITLPLFQIAKELGGQYQGWQCPLVER